MENNGQVKINSDLLINERKTKVWSQQHLADVAGISLRTIQRVEKTGVSSAESLKAISSAFDKQPSFFLSIENPEKKYNHSLIFAFSIGILLVALLAKNYLPASTQGKVFFVVEYKAELLNNGDINEGVWQLELDLNKEIKINLPNDFELVLLTYRGVDNDTLIDATLDRQNNASLLPNSAPTTITKKLNEGLTLGYEKDKEIVVAINISSAES